MSRAPAASPGDFEPTGPRIAKIRVANFYLLPDNKPGPALDFYDTSLPSKSDKPLISYLAYGQVSQYVSPRAEGPEADYTGGGDYGNLYMFPAGSKKFGPKIDGMQAGTNIDNAGWVTGEQQTVVIGDSSDEGYNSQPSFATVDEVEPSAVGQSALIKPKPGAGLLVANVNGLIEGTSKYGDVDLRIDGKCPDNILVTTGKPAQDSNDPTFPATLSNYNAANFPLPVGAHTLNVVAEPGPGSGLTQQQCRAAPAVATATVQISGSAPTIVFIYGASPHQAKMLRAKIE
jgi:hypothetical protein